MTLPFSSLLGLTLVFTVHAATLDCLSLEKADIPNGTIHAELLAGKEFRPPVGKPLTNIPEVCRAHLTLKPTADSNIEVELWLPTKAWNGKLQGIGNGGYAGSISYEALAEAVQQNYAAVSTDTGHEGKAEDATWALNHPEKIVDFGYRAIHLMTEDAKLLIQQFYGMPSTYSYFSSCSNGGRQALMEAQRFPTDYNGIIAGAPANYWTHLVSNSVANARAFLATKDSYIPTTKLPAIQAAAQSACDLNDHVKDGIIENPAGCHFDTSVLLCKGQETASCLNTDQITALNKLYSGSAFFPGYAPGGEAARGNWDAWITGPALGQSAMFAYGTQFFKNMVYNDPGWNVHEFQADEDVKTADQKLARILNSTDADLHQFISNGGKLVLYHGWDDAAISPFNSINYFDSLQKKMGATVSAKSIRLFMVPGMQHCGNGNGASIFGQFAAGGGDPAHDVDSALVQWVEKGIAPNELIASKPGTSLTHLICAYPATAKYKGSGDTASAASYTCEVTK